jgi:hypothetical protein
VPGPGKYSFE